MIIISCNEEETVLEGEKLGKMLNPGAVVALRGELGAGKTAFTRGIAKGLGVCGSVDSPTFTIVNEYPGNIPLFHFDMYRLESENELFDIGWDDYLERGGVCVVEWSEKVPGAFPPETVVVNIDNPCGDTRRLEIDADFNIVHNHTVYADHGADDGVGTGPDADGGDELC